MTVRVHPKSPATAADLARLPDDIAAEIIDGALVEKAAPSFLHGWVQGRLVGQLSSSFNRRSGGAQPGGWWIATSVEVRYDDAQIYRHDVAGWHRESTPEPPSGRPVRVRPTWVAEVLSPSDAANDVVKKLRTLLQHRVPHYWIVDPEYRTLMVLRWTADGYLVALTASEEEGMVRAEPFHAIELHVGVLFGREPDDL